ncbi:MAG: hypothetical protein U1E05_01565 [Patescibacteria group bacterium]|nr:hypothetical protein [Patescibacteria group bacterium]
MSAPFEQEHPLDGDFAQVHLAGPSAGLQDRVLKAGHAAWAEVAVSADVSWRLPVLRFAACATAATLLIGMANMADGHFVVMGRFRDHCVPAAAPSAAVEAYPGMSLRMVRSAPRPAAEALPQTLGYLRRAEQLRQAEPAPQGNPSDEPFPHSRLLPDAVERPSEVAVTRTVKKGGMV